MGNGGDIKMTTTNGNIISGYLQADGNTSGGNIVLNSQQGIDVSYGALITGTVTNNPGNISTNYCTDFILLEYLYSRLK